MEIVFITEGVHDNFQDATRSANNLEAYSNTSDENNASVQLSAKRTILRKENVTDLTNAMTSAVNDFENMSSTVISNIATKYSSILNQQGPFVALVNCDKNEAVEIVPPNQITPVSSGHITTANSVPVPQQTVTHGTSLVDPNTQPNQSYTTEYVDVEKSQPMHYNDTHTADFMNTFHTNTFEQYEERPTATDTSSVVLDLPTAQDLAAYLTENTVYSKMCSFILTGVNAVVDTKVNAMRKEMTEWSDSISKQIEFLGNVSWNCERSLKILENDKKTIVASHPVDSKPEDDTQPQNIKFPMETVESIQKFETDLMDEDEYKKI